MIYEFFCICILIIKQKHFMTIFLYFFLFICFFPYISSFSFLHVVFTFFSLMVLFYPFSYLQLPLFCLCLRIDCWSYIVYQVQNLFTTNKWLFQSSNGLLKPFLQLQKIAIPPKTIFFNHLMTN